MQSHWGLTAACVRKCSRTGGEGHFEDETHGRLPQVQKTFWLRKGILQVQRSTDVMYIVLCVLQLMKPLLG